MQADRSSLVVNTLTHRWLGIQRVNYVSVPNQASRERRVEKTRAPSQCLGLEAGRVGHAHRTLGPFVRWVSAY
jgi:hypothetical protein